MPNPRSPQIISPVRSPKAALGGLPPRVTAGGRWFGDEKLDLIAHALDDCFRIPGTAIRFGLDGLIGLIPGIGDLLAGLTSLILIVGAWFRGVPYITLTRMAMNVGIEVVVGSIPFVGDLFIIGWKANRRNYALLTRHLAQPGRHTWKDRVFLASVLILVGVIFLLPVVVILWALHWLFGAHPWAGR